MLMQRCSIGLHMHAVGASKHIGPNKSEILVHFNLGSIFYCFVRLCFFSIHFCFAVFPFDCCWACLFALCSVWPCAIVYVLCTASKHINTYLFSSNRLNGSGNNDDLTGAFIVIVINGFLLFFISLNNLFISCALATWVGLAFGTFAGPTTGTTGIGTGCSCTGCICTGCTGCICTTWAGRALTNVFGIWFPVFTVADTVSFRGVIKICVLNAHRQIIYYSITIRMLNNDFEEWKDLSKRW